MVNEVAAFDILLDRGYGHRALIVFVFISNLYRIQFRRVQSNYISDLSDQFWMGALAARRFECLLALTLRPHPQRNNNWPSLIIHSCLHSLGW